MATAGQYALSQVAGDGNSDQLGWGETVAVPFYCDASPRPTQGAINAHNAWIMDSIDNVDFLYDEFHLSTSEPFGHASQYFMTEVSPTLPHSAPEMHWQDNSYWPTGNDMIAELDLPTWSAGMMDHYRGQQNTQFASPISSPITPPAFTSSELSRFPQGWVESSPFANNLIEEGDNPSHFVQIQDTPCNSPNSAVVRSGYGWVRFGSMEEEGRQRMVRQNPNEGGRRALGRKGPLDPTTRKAAAEMRNKGACDSCRRRKAKCDQGAPCRSCIIFYKGDLVNNPCRGTLLDSFGSVLLSGNVFPKARTLESYLGQGRYGLSPDIHRIPINIGMGPSILMNVQLVYPLDSSRLFHQHMVYPWPPPPGRPAYRHNMTHLVFPAILVDSTGLHTILDTHLSQLVEEHFDSFPLFCSPFKVLHCIHDLYKGLPNRRSTILHTALKLLVLVHINGDVTVDKNNPAIMSLMDVVLPNMSGMDATPCFIRGQLGDVMSGLAGYLMKVVLTEIEKTSLTRQCSYWPVVLGTFAVLLMAVESANYHAAKKSYHDSIDHPYMQSASDFEAEFTFEIPDESGVEALLRFYHTCFSECHNRLRGDAVYSRHPLTTDPDQADTISSFISSLQTAVEGARGYLEQRKSIILAEAGDMSAFFDRQLAKLFLMT